MTKPLADRMRPRDLSEVVGQTHLVGRGGVLRAAVESGQVGNMIFYGPPGTGKTTVANIAAKAAGKQLYKLNGTTASTADVKGIIDELDSLMAVGGVVVYLDEIQYFNKKQQQTLLSFMESGRIALIASTTENPYFYVYPALLSRSGVFEFKPLTPDELAANLLRVAERLRTEEDTAVEFAGDALRMMAEGAGGDVRRSLNWLETALQLAAGANPRVITEEIVVQAAQGAPIFHDKDGDSHYDLLSAFQKSLRGSDPDAAVYYLARLLEGGDIAGACRRLSVTAAEDVGLAYPQALSVVNAAVEIALRVGLPEARIPLSDAVILVATSPKSNSGICAVDAALEDIRAGRGGPIPDDLRDTHYEGAAKLGRGKGYRYPHSYPGHYIRQQYLPDALVDAHYYEYGDNKLEQAAKAYLERIRGMGEE